MQFDSVTTEKLYFRRATGSTPNFETSIDVDANGTIRYNGPTLFRGNFVIQGGSNPTGTFATLTTARLLLGKGVDVPSATTVTLGTDGNVFTITGTTQIQGIVYDNWNFGPVFLQFSGSVTVVHNSGAPGAGADPILLAGGVNFAATANDTLTLIHIGATWVEFARTVI